MAKKGMGFKAAQRSIEKREGYSKERAGAILAAGARNASSAAKRANPNLKHVPGNKMGGSLHTPDYGEHREHTERVRKGGRGEACY